MKISDKLLGRRWIILGVDGHHTTLGRQAPPGSDEIEKVERQLQSMRVGGWVATVDGDYWCKRSAVRLTMVKPLAEPNTDFEVAAAAFEIKRNAILGV